MSELLDTSLIRHCDSALTVASDEHSWRGCVGVRHIVRAGVKGRKRNRLSDLGVVDYINLGETNLA